MPRTFAIAISILLATGTLIGACWLWAHAEPAMGQRSFEPARVWGTRCAALASVLIAHALLAGWTLPRIYRSRPVYIGAALCSGGIGVLGSVAAAGLLLACR